MLSNRCETCPVVKKRWNGTAFIPQEPVRRTNDPDPAIYKRPFAWTLFMQLCDINASYRCGHVHLGI